MKISFYCTVFNEESSIRSLIDSIVSQKKKPDEIIIVDGGSKDTTVEIIREYIEKGVQIKLIIAKGSNVAQGRNIGIENAKYDIIVSTDAGCVADANWLENLIKNFDENSDIITGICLPKPENVFEDCFAELLYPKTQEWKANWPSHQNIAFKKYVWEEIKYPDQCYRSEDTWFNLKVQEKGFRFKLAKDAIIYWRPRKNLYEVFKNTYLWNKSNIENDVRAENAVKVAMSVSFLLIWRFLSIVAMLFVFIFISKTAAIILSPFILKNIISLRFKDKNFSIIKIVYMNIILYTDMFATSLGVIAGKIAIKKKRTVKKIGVVRNKCIISK